MRALLIACLGALGISAVCIGIMFFFFGAQFTADFFNFLPRLFITTAAIEGFDTADIDGEFRFYSVFWIAYGGFLVYTAKYLNKMINWIPLLAGLFFMGGVGRVLSILQYGEPHILFQILLAVELSLPILIIGIWYSVKRST